MDELAQTGPSVSAIAMRGTRACLAFGRGKHFSATVLAGARRIAISGGVFKEVVAFQNADGSKVLAFASGRDRTGAVTAQVGDASGRRMSRSSPSTP